MKRILSYPAVVLDFLGMVWTQWHKIITIIWEKKELAYVSRHVPVTMEQTLGLW